MGPRGGAPRGSAVCPLLLSAMLPLLLQYTIWRSRELQFLVITAAFLFGLQQSLKTALTTPPIGAVLGRKRRTSQPVVDGVWRMLEHCGRAIPKFGPGLLVLLAAAGYATFFAYHTIVHHRNGLSSSLDLGMEDNLVYNALHGGPLFKSSPLGGPTAIHLGNHATWFTFLIVRSTPSARTPRRS